MMFFLLTGLSLCQVDITCLAQALRGLGLQCRSSEMPQKAIPGGTQSLYCCDGGAQEGALTDGPALGGMVMRACMALLCVILRQALEPTLSRVN